MKLKGSKKGGVKVSQTGEEMEEEDDDDDIDNKTSLQESEL